MGIPFIIFLQIMVHYMLLMGSIWNEIAGINIGIPLLGFLQTVDQLFQLFLASSLLAPDHDDYHDNNC